MSISALSRTFIFGWIATALLMSGCDEVSEFTENIEKEVAENLNDKKDDSNANSTTNSNAPAPKPVDPPPKPVDPPPPKTPTAAPFLLEHEQAEELRWSKIAGKRYAATKADLEFIAKMPNLLRLELNTAEINDEGMEIIGTITQLRQLRVANLVGGNNVSKITDAGVAKLAEMKNLQLLDISGNLSVDGSALELLTDAPLRGLCAATTKVGTQGLEHIAKFENLEYLDLFGSEATDITPLQNNRKLKMLSLSKCKQLKDIAAVKGMRELETLHVYDCNLLDENNAVRHLRGLRNLKELYIGTTRIPPNVANDLMARNRNLKVDRINGTKPFNLDFFPEDFPPVTVAATNVETPGVNVETPGVTVDTPAVPAPAIDPPSVSATPTVRTWSDTSGKFSIAATFGGVVNGEVVLKTTDGRELKVPLAQLSAADQKWVADNNK